MLFRSDWLQDTIYDYHQWKQGLSLLLPSSTNTKEEKDDELTWYYESKQDDEQSRRAFHNNKNTTMWVSSVFQNNHYIESHNQILDPIEALSIVLDIKENSLKNRIQKEFVDGYHLRMFHQFVRKTFSLEIIWIDHGYKDCGILPGIYSNHMSSNDEQGLAFCFMSWEFIPKKNRIEYGIVQYRNQYLYPSWRSLPESTKRVLQHASKMNASVSITSPELSRNEIRLPIGYNRFMLDPRSAIATNITTNTKEEKNVNVVTATVHDYFRIPGCYLLDALDNLSTIDQYFLSFVKKYPAWRYNLSDQSTEYPFSLQKKRWKSVYHYVVSMRFRESSPDFADTFAMDSLSDLSSSTELVDRVNTVQTTADNQSIRSPNIVADVEWGHSKLMAARDEAVHARINQHSDLKQMLEDTVDAQLFRFDVGEQRWLADYVLMNLRTEIWGK